MHQNYNENYLLINFHIPFSDNYIMKNLEHLCFDKDGVLIDVHAYWQHTTEIRANHLKNNDYIQTQNSLFYLEEHLY